MARKREKTEVEPRAADAVEGVEMPKRGDTFRCEQCGMELEVTVDCECDDPEMVRLECCAQPLTRV